MTEYGIAHDQSDWRCHVGWATGRAFFFKTESAKALDLSKFPKREARSNGGRYGVTACGYLIPINEMPGLVSVLFPHSWLDRVFLENFSYLTERDLGREALKCFCDIVGSGLAPISGPIKIENDRARQIAGIDAIVGSQTVQIKSDYGAGPKDQGGTGNIYLQTLETNPSRQK